MLLRSLQVLRHRCPCPVIPRSHRPRLVQTFRGCGGDSRSLLRYFIHRVLGYHPCVSRLLSLCHPLSDRHLINIRSLNGYQHYSLGFLLRSKNYTHLVFDLVPEGMIARQQFILSSRWLLQIPIQGAIL